LVEPVGVTKVNGLLAPAWVAYPAATSAEFCNSHELSAVHDTEVLPAAELMLNAGVAVEIIRMLTPKITSEVVVPAW
jgi:hypothetical protein